PFRSNKRWFAFGKNREAPRGASGDNDFVMNSLNMSTINPNAGLVVVGRDQGKVLSVVVYRTPADQDHPLNFHSQTRPPLDPGKGDPASGDLQARANTVTIVLKEILSHVHPFPHGGINE